MCAKRTLPGVIRERADESFGQRMTTHTVRPENEISVPRLLDSTQQRLFGSILTQNMTEIRLLIHGGIIWRQVSGDKQACVRIVGYGLLDQFLRLIKITNNLQPITNKPNNKFAPDMQHAHRGRGGDGFHNGG